MELPQHGPGNWSAYISSGTLPFLTSGKLPEFRKDQPELDAFLSAIETVLEAIPREYPGIRAEPSWRPNISQQERGKELDENEPAPSTPTEPPAGPVGARVAAAASEYGTPEDALGYETYANALGDLITHPDTGTPLAIAICAHWGMGKTTLMHYIKKRIDEIGLESGERYVKIDFNAWKYSKSEAIWAAFYSVILASVEKSLSRGRRLLFRGRVAKETHPVRFAAWWAGAAMLVAALAFLAYSLFSPENVATTGGQELQLKEITTVIENSPTPDSTTTLITRQPKPSAEPFFSLGSLSLKEAIPLVACLVGLISTIWGLCRSLSRRILGKVKRTGTDLLPVTQADVVTYVDSVMDWLKRQFEREKVGIKGIRKMPSRYVIFVDDIDRVQPNKVMQMMEAIKLFLEMPEFVFVLAMDAKVVRQAVGGHYDFMTETADEREKIGHDYLEKIIQIPFYLPELARSDLENLKDQLLNNIMKPIKAAPEGKGSDEKPSSEPEDTPPDESTETPTGVRPKEKQPTKAQATIDEKMKMAVTDDEQLAVDPLFKDGLKMSPRQVVRFWNVYLLARHIYLRRFPATGSPKPVFTKWIALSVRYPFDVKELVTVCIDTDWPASWQTVINRLAKEHGGTAKWDTMRKGDLEQLTGMLDKHIPSPQDVHPFVDITNCFNLALD